MPANHRAHPRIWIIVAAAGSGERFGTSLRKQYADLGGRPVLARTLDRLAALAAEAVVVALARDDSHYDRAIGDRSGVLALRCGGATRAATVRNALQALAPRCERDDWILVHDAARPCVPRDALVRILRELEDDPVGGLLALPPAETVKRVEESASPPRVFRTESRDTLWLAQTPQMFRYHVLVAAYDRDATSDCTDDAQAIERLAAAGGCPMPRLVEGSSENLKITRPGDLALALAVLRLQGDA